MTSNPFTSIKVFPNFSTGHVIQWALDPVFRGAEPYRFTLEASEMPTFSQLIFSKEAGSSFFVVDDTHVKQDWGDSYIYRIKLVTADGQVFYSRNQNFVANMVEARKFFMAAEITRKEFVRMHFVGRKGWLLKRKGYGITNAQEVDPVSGVPLTTNPIDYGTGLAGGYHEPLEIVYSEESEDHDIALDPNGFGVSEISNVTMRMVGFPYIDVKDILVNDNEERYVVWKTDQKVFPGTDISILQIAMLHRIPNSDSIYQLEVKK